jgi:DNA repair photolyase
MNCKKYEKNNLIFPVIISASRVTDIPAFFSEWFVDKLKRGYLIWKNPFNQKKYVVYFKNTRLIVFWTKYAEPMMKHLNLIDEMGFNYYFTYTVNDYEEENLEPNVPPLEKRIKNFIELSKKIGKEKVIWRFDPFILSDKITVNELIKKIERVGNEISKYTEKLVISFADINTYKKVRNNLAKLGDNYRELKEDEIKIIAKNLYWLAKKWGIEIATCAEKIDLSEYDIKHNRCIDPELILKLFNDDMELMKFLGVIDNETFKLNFKKLKDRGQRKECGCIKSKDIGCYNTCMHLCRYCYANFSDEFVKRNLKRYKPENESII